MRSAAIAILMFAAPAFAADRPMTGSEFEAYTTGKTLFFGTNGLDYGIEEYLEDRQVRWSFLGDECVDGIWYERESYICFRYERRIGEQCWQFFLDENGLTARVAGDPGPPDVYEIRQSPEPMQCLGPRIGV